MKKQDILSKIKEENLEMVRLVHLDNFIKCIGNLFGKSYKEIFEYDTYCDSIAYYLNNWAEQKRWLYDTLYNKSLTISTKFEEKLDVTNYRDQFMQLSEIEENYLFRPYLAFLAGHVAYKDGQACNLYTSNSPAFYSCDNYYLPQAFTDKINQEKEIKITTVASKYFHLPQKLVDALGRILDNNKRKCTLTLSIDPVDILTCSVNPYNWTSCYSIANHCGSHADGALAAMVDSSSQVIYGWIDEGELELTKSCSLKNVKFKLFRSWLNLASDFKTLYVTTAYPYRDTEHTKEIRLAVEDILDKYLNNTEKWHQFGTVTKRVMNYGYDEFSRSGYSLHSSVDQWIEVYDTPLVCLDNVEEVFIGSDEEIYDDEAFDEYCSTNSMVCWEDFEDEDGNHDEDAYYDACDAERDQLYQEFIQSCGNLNPKYGLQDRCEVYQFDSGYDSNLVVRSNYN